MITNYDYIISYPLMEKGTIMQGLELLKGMSQDKAIINSEEIKLLAIVTSYACL